MNIRQSTTFVDSLPPELQREARISYTLSIKSVFYFATVSTLLAYLVRIPVRQAFRVHLLVILSMAIFVSRYLIKNSSISRNHKLLDLTRNLPNKMGVEHMKKLASVSMRRMTRMKMTETRRRIPSMPRRKLCRSNGCVVLSLSMSEWIWRAVE